MTDTAYPADDALIVSGAKREQDTVETTIRPEVVDKLGHNHVASLFACHGPAQLLERPHDLAAAEVRNDGGDLFRGHFDLFRLDRQRQALLHPRFEALCNRIFDILQGFVARRKL